MKLSLQDRILTEAKILASWDRLIFNTWYILPLVGIDSGCSSKLGTIAFKNCRFKQRNIKVLPVSCMGGSTCYSLVLSLRMFLCLYEKYKHTSFFCIISFHIEKCSGLDLLFRREILKKILGFYHSTWGDLVCYSELCLLSNLFSMREEYLGLLDISMHTQGKKMWLSEHCTTWIVITVSEPWYTEGLQNFKLEIIFFIFAKLSFSYRFLHKCSDS